MTAAPENRGRQKFLLTQTQLRDQCLIAALVLLFQIVEEAATLVDHHQQAAAAVIVLVVPVKNDTLKFKTPKILLNITSFDLIAVSFKSMLFVDKKSDNLVCIAV